MGERRAAPCFFFFQAEDGIRGYKVTGVQTCALPILFCKTCGVKSFARGTGPKGEEMVAINLRCLDGVDVFAAQAAAKQFDGKSRSEERRVGKECRYGWSPDCARNRKKIQRQCRDKET